jgi:hypothetical protein
MAWFFFLRVDPTATRISTEKVLRLPVTSANQGAARGAGKVHETPGVGQESVAMHTTDPDDEGIDPAVDFEMDLPASDNHADHEIYDDYNDSYRGFFATPFTAEDVGQQFMPHRKYECNFNTVHLEELSASSNGQIPTADVAIPTDMLWDIQEELQILLNVELLNDRKDFAIRSNRSQSGPKRKKVLSDIVDLYDWGLR